MASSIQFSATPTLVPPAPAFANGMTLNVLNDNFISTNTIDLTKSGSAGFNWYLKHAWPSVANAGVSSPQRDNWLIFTDQVSANFSVSNPTSGLAVTDVPSGGGGIALISAQYQATAPSYVGNVFGPGFYAEMNMNLVNATPGFGSIACVSLSLPFLLGQAAHFVEVDFMETTGATTFHQGYLVWDTTVNPATNSGGPFVNETYDGAFHTYGMLWLTKAMNGGTGLIAFYLDNVLIQSYTYTTGADSIIDTHPQVIYSCSPGFQTSVTKFARVWQRP